MARGFTALFQRQGREMKIDLNGAGDPAGPIRRRAGKPRGYPKPPGSGRQKLVGATPDELRAEIGSVPVSFLLDLTLGRKVRVGGPNGSRIWRYPSLSERQAAANRLLSRVLPELQKSETTIDATVSGSVTGGLESDDGLGEIARRLAFVLTSARDARAERAIEHEPVKSIESAPATGLRIVNGGGRYWVQQLAPLKLLAGFESEAEATRELERLKGNE
jgi:hypothetical protein